MNTSLKLEGFKVATGNHKTNIFGMAFINTVTRENIIKSAILSEIFLNSSKLFKTPVEINRRLNKMNGAVFNVGTCKKGDNLCLTVILETLKNISDMEAEGFIEDIKDNKAMNAVTVVAGTALGGLLLYGIYKLISKFAKWLKR